MELLKEFPRGNLFEEFPEGTSASLSDGIVERFPLRDFLEELPTGNIWRNSPVGTPEIIPKRELMEEFSRGNYWRYAPEEPFLRNVLKFLQLPLNPLKCPSEPSFWLSRNFLKNPPKKASTWTCGIVYSLGLDRKSSAFSIVGVRRGLSSLRCLLNRLSSLSSINFTVENLWFWNSVMLFFFKMDSFPCLKFNS